MKRILSMIFYFIFLLCCIQTLGNYLVQEMRLLQETPKVEIQREEEVTTYKVLRLEPCEYYTVHLGTYEELLACQEKINCLLDLGYRPFVAKQLPYKIRLGCFASENEISQLPQEILRNGQDVYLEKCLHNQHSLKFKAGNAFAEEYLAPLVASYDILLRHSLKMFQNWHIDTYSEELWQQMIAQLQTEGENLITHLTASLEQKDCSPLIYGELEDLREATENYLQSLEKLLLFLEDLKVWTAQSYLLELFEQYEQILKLDIE